MQGTWFFEILSHSRVSRLVNLVAGKTRDGCPFTQTCILQFPWACCIQWLYDIFGGTFIIKHSVTTEAIFLNRLGLVMRVI